MPASRETLRRFTIIARTNLAPAVGRRLTVTTTLLLTSGVLLLGCSSASEDPTAATSSSTSTSTSAGAAVTLVDPAQALALAARQGTTVIDVRTPDEYATGHLAGAVNIDVSADTFADQVSALDPAGSYVVYCRSGARSAAAATQMADLGFTDIADAGALTGLTDAGAATEIS